MKRAQIYFEDEVWKVLQIRAKQSNHRFRNWCGKLFGRSILMTSPGAEKRSCPPSALGKIEPIFLTLRPMSVVSAMITA